MYLAGHMAYGFIMGIILARVLKVRTSMPLLMFAAALPDVDLVLEPLGIRHGGPTHSLLLIALASVPLVAHRGRGAVPYIAAAMQHPGAGDVLTGSIQLLWPLSEIRVGAGLGIGSSADLAAEALGVLAFTVAYAKTGCGRGDAASLLPTAAIDLSLKPPPWVDVRIPDPFIALHIPVLAILTLELIHAIEDMLARNLGRKHLLNSGNRRTPQTGL